MIHETTKDSINYYKNLLNQNDFKNNNKLVDIVTFKSMRVSYIYLNGKEMNFKDIDLTRKTILKDYTNGIAFYELAKKHSMDGSSEKGGRFRLV